MALEIERKFLVTSDAYKNEATGSRRMIQGYLCPGSGKTVRVRLESSSVMPDAPVMPGLIGHLTIKGPSADGGLSRFEWEKEISEDDARALLTLAEDSIIDKTRWLVPAGDGIHTWEVDEFYGDNAGLVVAEIELGSPTESFPHPSWLGAEVTGDHRYYNARLVKVPYKDWGTKELL